MDRMICDFQVVGPVQTNCYFFYHEDSKECILIDPGDEFDRIERYVEKKGLKVTAVLLTHGHFDHIMALKKVKERYGAPVYAAREEQPVLEDPVKNLSGAMGGTPVVEQADVYLEDGQEIEVMRVKIRCILTPGHTCGGMCYYVPNEGILFSGDTLFQDSVGRTDFPTSSMSSLIRSIREKLFVLPGAVRVFPGHGMMTSIEHEKMFNPFAVE